MNALGKIAIQAATDKKEIVLPEGTDIRVLAAASQAAAQGLAEVIVIGNPDNIMSLAKSGHIKMENIRLLDPVQNEQAQRHADVLFEARKHKGVTPSAALEGIRSPLVLAACMVRCGDADGCVAGAVNTTTDVVRTALQIVGMNPKSGLVSSFFVMQHDLPHQAIQGTALYADCAMVIEPDANQLATIAIDTADSAIAIMNMKPRVALLSFSTAGSANHPHVSRVREAGEFVARQRPDIALIPEVQFDAAIIPQILQRKAPAIKTEAPANVFIFPDLQSANIGYKIAQRIGGVTAVGPVLQGLARPVNDLSRGCSVDDIVKLVAVTAVQAQSIHE